MVWLFHVALHNFQSQGSYSRNQGILIQPCCTLHWTSNPQLQSTSQQPKISRFQMAGKAELPSKKNLNAWNKATGKLRPYNIIKYKYSLLNIKNSFYIYQINSFIIIDFSLLYNANRQGMWWKIKLLGLELQRIN